MKNTIKTNKMKNQTRFAYCFGKPLGYKIGAHEKWEKSTPLFTSVRKNRKSKAVKTGEKLGFDMRGIN